MRDSRIRSRLRKIEITKDVLLRHKNLMYLKRDCKKWGQSLEPWADRIKAIEAGINALALACKLSEGQST